MAGTSCVENRWVGLITVEQIQDILKFMTVTFAFINNFILML